MNHLDSLNMNEASVFTDGDINGYAAYAACVRKLFETADLNQRLINYQSLAILTIIRLYSSDFEIMHF